MKKIHAFILLIIYVSAAVLYAFAPLSQTCYAAAPEVDLNNFSYVLMECDTGTVLEKNHESDIKPMGTLNKLMTALLVMEKIETGKLTMDTELIASSDACNASGAVIWLEKGDKITVYELMKGMLAGNANDAANMLAEGVAQSKDNFVALMNSRAAELEMKDTVFTKPGESDDENQVTTALDMAILSREVAAYTVLHDIMTVRYELIRDNKAEVVNENKLVTTYNGITGLKASHTKDSGYSVAASATRESGSYVAVVLGAVEENEQFTAAKQILNNGFAKYKSVTPGFDKEFMKPLTVKHGVDSAVEIDAYRISELIISRGTEGKIKTVVVLPEYIEAPVRKNQCIGVLAFYCGDTLLYETQLVTQNSVQKNTFFKSFRKIISKMFK